MLISCNQLKKYLESREDECNALFINGKKKRIAHQTVQNICKLAYKLAGLEDYNYTTHTLRHTAATYIYSESKNILVVKNFLGHSSIASTQIYTHLINDELKRAVDSNPLSDFTTEIEKDRDIANERN